MITYRSKVIVLFTFRESLLGVCGLVLGSLDLSKIKTEVWIYLFFAGRTHYLYQRLKGSDNPKKVNKTAFTLLT